MRSYATLLASSALALMAANTDAGSTPAPKAAATPEPAPTPAPAPKFYMATAKTRKPASADAAKTITFVVSGPDYKSAWEAARKVTQLGVALFVKDFPDTVFADNERKAAPVDFRPGEFTVESVQSLQQRSAKVKDASLDDLLAKAQEANIKIPESVAKLIEDMKSGQAKAPEQAAA